LPSASGLVALSDETISGSTYSASAGYDYVVFHFGAGPAGSPGGWWQAFYLGGTEGSFTVPTVGGRSVGDFSSARFYNPVPDSGSTVMLLGTALLVLGVASRRFATR